MTAREELHKILEHIPEPKAPAARRFLRTLMKLPGRRTALTVCHAISMAMTVVLPAPVASLRARRKSSGFASLLAFFKCSRNWLPVLPSLGATSVNQMAISTASI